MLASEAGDDDFGDVLLEIYEGDDKMETLFRTDDIFKNGYLAYLCGYVAWKLRLLIKCLMCYKALFNSPEDEVHPLAMDFLKKKAKWITFPSNNLCKIVRAADQVFERAVIAQTKVPTTPKLVEWLTAQVIRTLDIGQLFQHLKSMYWSKTLQTFIQCHLQNW